MPQTPWTLQDLPDQTGRIAVVTGATSGTGWETANVLAGRGATVVLACRNAEKTEAALQRIRAAHPGAQVSGQALDLGSLRSVREAAAALRARFDHLDLLINNAGVMIPPYGKTEDGFETQIGTNHHGHFAFTGLLLDRLLAAAGSRVVTMSSAAHKVGRINFEDLHSERGYRAVAAYGQSKLANLLFTYALQRRLAAAGAGTLALAAHPGWARTELQRHVGGLLNLPVAIISPFFSQGSLAGALPLLRAATDPTAQGGDYFGPGGFLEMKGSPVRVAAKARAHEVDVQERLWQRSEQDTGVAYVFN